MSIEVATATTSPTTRWRLWQRGSRWQVAPRVCNRDRLPYHPQHPRQQTIRTSTSRASCVLHRSSTTHSLNPGDRLPGPAIICSATSTVVVDPGWQATMYSGGELLIDEQGQKQKKKHEVTTESDPIMLEVFNNRFMAIARQMGITLRNTASSVNVKPTTLTSVVRSLPPMVRLSPTHPMCRCISEPWGQPCEVFLRKITPLKPGDVYLTNDPYRGGSHLPDITVVTPVHDPNDNRLLFFHRQPSASRRNRWHPTRFDAPLLTKSCGRGRLARQRRPVRSGSIENQQCA